MLQLRIPRQPIGLLLVGRKGLGDALMHTCHVCDAQVCEGAACGECAHCKWRAEYAAQLKERENG